MTDLLQVEEGVEIPERRQSYPFRSMLPGHSFVVTGLLSARKVRNAAYQFAARANKLSGALRGDREYVSFLVRKVGSTPEGEPIYRMWRE